MDIQVFAETIRQKPKLTTQIYSPGWKGGGINDSEYIVEHPMGIGEGESHDMGCFQETSLLRFCRVGTN